MRVTARKTLVDHVASLQGHRDQASLRRYLENWFHEVQRAKWLSSADLKAVFNWASIISADRVVFDVLTNRYRLVAAIDYEKGIVWIKCIGTHADYDKVDVREVQHGGD